MMKPDFRTWAENITNIYRKYGTAQDEISRALEQAFDQGYHLGLNKGWAIEQDKETSGERWTQYREFVNTQYEPPYERLSDSCCSSIDKVSK